MGPVELEKELKRLIKQYSKKYDAFMFVYSSSISKGIPDVALSMDDYYVIADILRDIGDIGNIDFYLETPGGSGEAAEEIIRFIRDRFPDVILSFLISGEAKSAGTLLALGGNEILMTKTGSLGPIDAQIPIGRMIISAYDYMEWIDDKRKEATKNKTLNPFDAVMIAQISPGEIKSVYNSLQFAKDLVIDWLCNYKFKDWIETETRKKTVTAAMKEKRANEIADQLINHGRWRTHRRSLKIDDLMGNLGLQITCIDDDPDKADIVYRIQTITRLLFDTTSTYKIFATENMKLAKSAVPMNEVRPKLPQKIIKTPNVIEIEAICAKCKRKHVLYAKFVPNPAIDKEQKEKGLKPFPKGGKIICECNYEIDLTGLRNDLESKFGKKMVL
jgi:hypothetical protein